MIKLSAEVFKFDKDNVKTLYRRAQAFYNQQDFELAHAGRASLFAWPKVLKVVDPNFVE